MRKNINFHVVLSLSRFVRLWLLIKVIKWILIDLKIAVKQSRQTIYFNFLPRTKLFVAWASHFRISECFPHALTAENWYQFNVREDFPAKRTFLINVGAFKHLWPHLFHLEQAV